MVNIQENSIIQNTCDSVVALAQRDRAFVGGVVLWQGSPDSRMHVN